MTSPNRETEAQQAKDRVEQSLHTREKASLMIKRGKTINLAMPKNLSQNHSEHPDLQEKEIQEALSLGAKTIQENLNQEVPAVILNPDLEKTVIIKASVLEALAQGISNRVAETTTAETSNLVLLVRTADQEISNLVTETMTAEILNLVLSAKTVDQEISNLATETTTAEISNLVLSAKMLDQEKLLLEKANVAI